MPQLRYLPLRLQPDAARVVIRPFHVAVEPRGLNPSQRGRAQRIVDSVLAMDARSCLAELGLVYQDFGERHRDITEIFERRYRQMAAELDMPATLHAPCRALIGAYFCHEYSYAAAALMNPSIVPHPNQSGLAEGAMRFVLSLRAVGEGHISSVEFREGVVHADGNFELVPLPLVAMAVEGQVEQDVARLMRERRTALSGTVLFPVTAAQRNGLEDLRLVRFVEEDGQATYYGTYTAYSGTAIASELLTTADFNMLSLRPLSGDAARNKGMALFPRRIDGRYAMIGRQDGESLYFLQSDDLLRWDGGDWFAGPLHPWELVQIGNCGSPIELDEGWLLLTHGVGPVRKYAIGAMLLAKDDPRKVLARSAVPILSPADDDREGYVPNVVYTCGAMALGRRLFLPYGIADSMVGFCWLDIDELLAELV
ncbi:glycoside hydrolase family 130 protein [Sphingomonas flavalba]|uniref:glycoside hydrolase family 130 protein n=1 Tax=Sphingomonas flavalba TaxID=2559804 RepID=UPI00109E2227|nr:glycoside hydrolase family 130 protein [Sphingomonas flavalba]